MIDIHNHFLPGIDDGARDMQEALAMARLAVADGVTHLVCTPHIHPGIFDNSLETIEPAVDAYRSALEEAGLPLMLAAAAEVHFGVEVMSMFANKTLPWLGEWEGRRVLLLEFPHSGLPFGAERLVDWLLERDVIPMIAHPERNRDFLMTPNRLALFTAKGCLAQVTGSALTDAFGKQPQACAARWIVEGQITCIASDAHNLDRRPPNMSNAARAARELVGEQAADQLTCDNPWKIVASLF